MLGVHNTPAELPHIVLMLHVKAKAIRESEQVFREQRLCERWAPISGRDARDGEQEIITGIVRRGGWRERYGSGARLGHVHSGLSML